jgi:hypothetical protein
VASQLPQPGRRLSRACSRRVALAALGALVASGTLPLSTFAADPIPTTVSLSQSPPYVYPRDTVTVTATVTPNPGGGSVWFNHGYGDHYVNKPEPVNPATGVAEHTFVAISDLNGGLHVAATFGGADGFEQSTAHLMLDLRYLPNVVITEAPPEATKHPEATFVFSVSPGVPTDCRVDGGSWIACSTPWTVTGLEDGVHTFEVLPMHRTAGRAGALRRHGSSTGSHPSPVTSPSTAERPRTGRPSRSPTPPPTR